MQCSNINISVFVEDGVSDIVATEDNLSDFRCWCCCFGVHIKVATALVAGVSSILILTNFLAKLCGYSEIGWNFELLFMIVDGAALTALIYGLYTDNAAFLQPFVALSIITSSLLVLLAAYLGTAVINSNSYAAQRLELELNKRLSDAARRLNLEFKLSENKILN
uniref:Transmembrane protein n=1 Tax=Meloidogyne floridensis TaxID=298350 RepID=A0A915P5C5_9BILA